jgi:hypothetical protein
LVRRRDDGRDRKDVTVNGQDVRTGEFERHRAHLRAVAYRMLGSLSVADGTVFPAEIFQAARGWVEKVYANLVYFNELDRGGHFAAREEPGLFSTEIQAAFSSLVEKGKPFLVVVE